jgi:uncharacterized membrane protein YjjP (DUF1212 family)
MSTRKILSRIIIFVFLALVGFALAMAFYYGSFMGIVLAFIALGAGINFLYLLNKAKRELEEAEEMV